MSLRRRGFSIRSKTTSCRLKWAKIWIKKQYLAAMESRMDNRMVTLVTDVKESLERHIEIYQAVSMRRR